MPPKKKQTTNNKNTNNKKKKKTNTINRNTNTNRVTVNNIISAPRARRPRATTSRNVTSRVPSLPEFASVNQLNQLHKDEIDNKIKNFDDRIKMLHGGNFGGAPKLIQNKPEETSNFEIPKLNNLSSSEILDLHKKGETMLFNNASHERLKEVLKQLGGVYRKTYDDDRNKLITAIKKKMASKATTESNRPASSSNMSTPIRTVNVRSPLRSNRRVRRMNT